MLPTSISLLDRLKSARADGSDWGRLQEMYRPLLLGWLGRVPGLGDEAEDLVQEVLTILIREIPRFDRRREGSFRAWLRQVSVNQVRTWRRQKMRRPTVGLDPAEGFLDRLADPSGDLALEWDREHDRHVTQKLLAAVRPDFKPTTWEAFQKFALDGLPASLVASELGISENAVIQSKSRILKRLREEAGELLG
jgi:RNA polymerase sigma-70 factor, ECF subfamily